MSHEHWKIKIKKLRNKKNSESQNWGSEFFYLLQFLIKKNYSL